MSKNVCRFCKSAPPSSREHVIADSRLRQIKSFKTANDDNLPKRFKGITCKQCNNNLGAEYESLSSYHLAYATVWKVVAGNINKAFSRMPEYQLNNSNLEALISTEAQLHAILNDADLTLPDFTVEFDIDATSSFSETLLSATKKVRISPVDEQGNPIEGAVAYIKDKAGGDNEKGYKATSDSAGVISMEILMRYEAVRVVTEESILQNTKTGETITTTIDVITYISQSANTRRLAVIIPIMGSVSTPWPNVRINRSHGGFLPIIQNAYPEMKIAGLRSFFTPDKFAK